MRQGGARGRGGDIEQYAQRAVILVGGDDILRSVPIEVAGGEEDGLLADHELGRVGLKVPSPLPRWAICYGPCDA